MIEDSWVGIVSNVLATSDGGKSWHKAYEDTGSGPMRPFPLHLWGISTPTPDLAIVTADSGYILRTTDGGRTWEEHLTIQTEQVLFGGDVSMYDTNHGLLVWKWPWFDTATGHEFLMATDDGGKTWSPMPVSPVREGWSGEIQDPLCFGPGRYICLVIDSLSRSHIASTSDGGRTWTYAENPVETENSLRFTHFQFFDSLFGYMGAVDIGSGWVSVFARTTDGRATWDLLHHGQIEGEFGGMYSISFRDRMNGIAGGPGSIFRTSDGGLTWSRDSVEDQVPSSPGAIIVSWLGEDGGVAVTHKGKAFVIDTRASSAILESSLSLYLTMAILPNPIGPDKPIRARLLLAEGGIVRLELYDLTGSCLLSTDSGLLPSGLHDVEIRVPGLQSGHYLLRAVVGEQVVESKVVVR